MDPEILSKTVVVYCVIPDEDQERTSAAADALARE